MVATSMIFLFYVDKLLNIKALEIVKMMTTIAFLLFMEKYSGFITTHKINFRFTTKNFN